MNLQHWVAQGLRNSEIAARLGVHPSTITRRLRAQGLTNPRLQLTERRRRIQELHRAGFTTAEIAQSQGVSHEVVYKDLRRLTDPNNRPRQTGKPA